jgi:hypothetical protein
MSQPCESSGRRSCDAGASAGHAAIERDTPRKLILVICVTDFGGSIFENAVGHDGSLTRLLPGRMPVLCTMDRRCRPPMVRCRILAGGNILRDFFEFDECGAITANTHAVSNAYRSGTDFVTTEIACLPAGDGSHAI